MVSWYRKKSKLKSQNILNYKYLVHFSMNSLPSTYTNRHLLLHLLTVSLMVHYGFTEHFSPWQMVAATTASIVMLFRPTELFWPLLAVGMTLLDYAVVYPELSNHAVIQFFICLGIVFLAVREQFTKKPFFSADRKSSVLRATVFLIYFFSGFHKINYGFLDADQSCVHTLNGYIVRVVAGEHASMPLWLTRFMQLATFFLELIVPFGLLFARTCKAAVYSLFLLHGYLFMAGFAHFASVSMVILPACLLNYHNKDEAEKIRQRLKPYVYIAAIASVFCIVLCNMGDKKFEGQLLSRWFFLCCGIYFIAFLYGINLFRSVRPVSIQKKAYRHYTVILPILFIFLWGMEPYYGLSNRANMSMYSNMITMAGRDNHLLINTKYTKLIPFEEDYVQVLEVSESFRRFFGNDYQYYYYPVITFRKRAADALKKMNEPVFVRLLYHGKEIVIDDLQKSPWSASKWYDRYFYYRPTPKPGLGICVW